MSGPLPALSDWDDFVGERYQPGKEKEAYRVYDNAPPVVREFYRLNHTNQTRDFALAKRREFGTLDRRRMGIWEAMEYLNTLVDDSDPDTDLTQIEHLLQAAEAARADGQPKWFVLTALIHDLGKILCLWGEPQWAVVGDTFPVGCAYSDKVVYPEFFQANPDNDNPGLNTKYGVYEANCGLRNVTMSWGHDEYVYQMLKDYIPEEGLYMLRYHSFYAWHREGAYDHLLDDHDRSMLKWVKLFNPYDLYSKSPEPPDWKKLRPFYEDLAAKYLPAKLKF